MQGKKMPRVKTLQIIWNGNEPVYSLDFHPDGTLFTAGADKEIKAWEVSLGGRGSFSLNYSQTI